MCISQLFFSVGVCVSVYYLISFMKSFILHIKVLVLSKINSTDENFSKKYGSWAIVTGASAGIGLAYARELASRKMNVVLISCEEEDLKRVSAKMETDFSIQTKIICVDFTDGRHVYEVIAKELEGLQIGVLVNNVGINKLPQAALDMTADFMRNMVLVNCIPAVMMTRFILPRMIENHCGAIVTVSSCVDQQPTPSLALYSATKAFITVFMKALQLENRGSGVTIQILSPGGVNTLLMTEEDDKIMPNDILLPNATRFAKNTIHTLGILDHTTGSYFYGLLTTILETVPASLRSIIVGYLVGLAAPKENADGYLTKLK